MLRHTLLGPSWTTNYEWMSGYTVRFGIYYIDYYNKLERKLHFLLMMKIFKSLTAVKLGSLRSLDLAFLFQEHCIFE